MVEREKRHYLRIPCELELSLKNPDDDPSSQPLFAMIRDISRGGIRIRVDRFIPLSNILTCRLNLPGHREIEVRGVPTWSAELPHLGCYDIGVRFIDASEEAEQTIRDFEYELLLKQGTID